MSSASLEIRCATLRGRLDAFLEVGAVAQRILYRELVIGSALDLVGQNPDPSDEDIRAWLEGNLCRCTGYDGIVKAVSAGARAMRADSTSPTSGSNVRV